MASQKKTILYGRLSQEDARLGDSNSIVNQRLLLEKYATDNGFENAIFWRTMVTAGQTSSAPLGKKSLR